MAYEWNTDLTEDERAAMTAMNVDPGFMDHSSECVLEAYRHGRNTIDVEDLEEQIGMGGIFEKLEAVIESIEGVRAKTVTHVLADMRESSDAGFTVRANANAMADLLEEMARHGVGDGLMCAWWCVVCRCCHANACSRLWGGDHVAAPCDHD